MPSAAPACATSASSNPTTAAAMRWSRTPLDRHIIHRANCIIGRARERMKAGQRSDQPARRDRPDGGEHEAIDALTGGGRCSRCRAIRFAEAQIALSELRAMGCSRRERRAGRQWGRFAVIARRWQDLKPAVALRCLRAIPVQMQRDSGQLSLHVTREGDALLSLLRGEHRRTGAGGCWCARLLSRWFRRRFHAPPEGLIEHPVAALAQFIVDAESAVPGGEPGRRRPSSKPSTTSVPSAAECRRPPNAPPVLMTAHRAKGLEFDHADPRRRRLAGQWRRRAAPLLRRHDPARRRSRCARSSAGGIPSPVSWTAWCCARGPKHPPNAAAHRIWVAGPGMIVLSGPGRYAPAAPASPRARRSRR